MEVRFSTKSREPTPRTTPIKKKGPRESSGACSVPNKSPLKIAKGWDSHSGFAEMGWLEEGKLLTLCGGSLYGCIMGVLK